jgi:hypothetical protein
MVEVIVIFIKIITPTDSADRLAYATRKAFRERVPEIARELAGTGRPVQPEPDEPQVVYQVSDPAPASLGGGLRRRNIAMILTTVAVMTAMSALGRPLPDVLAAGTLFVAAAPLIAYYQRKYAKGEATK